MSEPAAPLYELVIPQGATFVRTFIWKDAAGVVMNLTGYIARLQVRESHDATVKLLDLVTSGGAPALVITALLGKITMTVPAAVTALLDFDEGVWDLEVESPGGVVTRLVQGTAKLDREATR